MDRWLHVVLNISYLRLFAGMFLLVFGSWINSWDNVPIPSSVLLYADLKGCYSSIYLIYVASQQGITFGYLQLKCRLQTGT